MSLAPDSTYLVTLKTPDQVDYAAASAFALSEAPRAISGVDRNEVTAASDDPISMIFAAGTYIVSGNYVLEVIGNGVSPSTQASFLISTQKPVPIVLRGLRGDRVQITRVNQMPPISKVSGAAFNLHDQAVGHLSLDWTDLPLRVEASCLDTTPAELNLFNTTTGNFATPDSGGSLVREPGVYVVRIQQLDRVDTLLHKCQIRLHSDSAPITQFGLTGLSIPSGKSQSALALRFSDEGLVLLDVDSGLSYSLACNDMSTASSAPSSKRFVGLIPSKGICVLTIDRSDSSEDQSVSVLTLKTPTGRPQRVSR